MEIKKIRIGIASCETALTPFEDVISFRHFKLTKFLVEIFNTEMRIGDVVIVVGDPRCFALLGHPGLVIHLELNNKNAFQSDAYRPLLWPLLDVSSGGGVHPYPFHRHPFHRDPLSQRPPPSQRLLLTPFTETPLHEQND